MSRERKTSTGEANKRLRAERRNEKVKRRGSGDRGKFAGLLVTVCQSKPNNVFGQLAGWLDKARKQGIPAAIGRPRLLGAKRMKEFGAALKLSVADLRNAGVPIQNLSDLGQKQVVTLVRFWGEKGLAEGTIADRVSVLRRFLQLVGKQDAVPVGVEWRGKLQSKGIVAGTIGRSHIPELPKGWVDLGIDAAALIEKIREYCPVVASQSEMFYAFGLRSDEGNQVQPRISDRGTHVFLIRGTKGKKERSVPFSKKPEKAAWQREVLERAKLVADKNPKGELAEAGLSLEQMRNRQRYVFRKFGITRSEGGLGVTPHGLRHQFATDLFFDLTGMPAPVLGLLPAEEYKRNWVIVREAYLEISRQMGHERPSITAAYAATGSSLGKHQLARVSDWLLKVQSAAPALEAAGVKDVWITGRCALGMALMPDEAIPVAVRLADESLSLRAAEAALTPLRGALEVALANRVTVTVWAGIDAPADGAEAMFAPGRGAEGQGS